MKKLNNLRKVYLWYLILTAELVCTALIICAGYLTDPDWRLILRIAGIAGAVIAPAAIWVMYRLLRRDNADTSDELEQMVVMRALAVTGLAAVTLVPVLVLLSFMAPSVAGFAALGYAIILWGTFKIATLWLYKKY